MEYKQYPYPDENLYFAVHKNKSSGGDSLELSKGKNQGIYVSDSLANLRAFIRAFAPGEASKMTLCYSLPDLRKIKTMLENKLKNTEKVKKTSFGIGKRKLWGYVTEDNVRVIRFYLARNKDELAGILKSKHNKILKAAFTTEEVIYIINNMEKVQKGDSDQYNFVKNKN